MLVGSGHPHPHTLSLWALAHITPSDFNWDLNHHPYMPNHYPHFILNLFLNISHLNRLTQTDSRKGWNLTASVDLQSCQNVTNLSAGQLNRTRCNCPLVRDGRWELLQHGSFSSMRLRVGITATRNVLSAVCWNKSLTWLLKGVSLMQTAARTASYAGNDEQTCSQIGSP